MCVVATPEMRFEGIGVETAGKAEPHYEAPGGFMPMEIVLACEGANQREILFVASLRARLELREPFPGA